MVKGRTIQLRGKMALFPDEKSVVSTFQALGSLSGGRFHVGGIVCHKSKIFAASKKKHAPQTCHEPHSY
jgi:hypothetical protein